MGTTLPGRFRLLDYFKLASLVAFVLFAVAIFFLERAELTFFEDIQSQQGAEFERAQDELVSAQKDAARASLVMEHEAGHIALGTVMANVLWDDHFAPLVARAQLLPNDGQLGARIRALPGFAAADAAVHELVRGSTVFKVKVYDVHGRTIYSSEHAQIGEDKSRNSGWKSAIAGKPASELVHRDRFSAFEGEVENRDLIQTYVPIKANETGPSGVFEIYSDVTPLLRHLDEVAKQIGVVASASRVKVNSAWRQGHDRVDASAAVHTLLLGAMLVALYGVLYMLVARGQRIIDEQAAARDAALERERQWHHEKMAALATMAANASHKIGNPLAVICGLAEDLPRAAAAGEDLQGSTQEILSQARRIAEMTRRITAFAAARSESAEPVDVNELVRAVRDFMSFDRRYRRSRIEADLREPLPACTAVPDHLIEALMNLMQAHAEASQDAGATVFMTTLERSGHVIVRIDRDGGAPLDAADWRVEVARERIQGMGGQFTAGDLATEIVLPCAYT
jgi:signal transduction histidine kinase